MRDPVGRLIELISVEVVLEMAEEEARSAGFEAVADECATGRHEVLRAKQEAEAALDAELAVDALRPGGRVCWVGSGGVELVGTLQTAYRGCRARVALPDGRQCYVVQEALRAVNAETLEA